MSDPYAGATAGTSNRSAQLDLVLATLLRQAPDLEAASVVSFDGLPMASALPAGMDEDRVAAMSAALLSLGERAAQGLGRGELSQVYVEGDNGTVFLVSADDEAVLVAVGRRGAKVGLMLFEVKQAAEAVANSLRIEHESTQPPLVAVAPVPEEAAPEPVAEPVLAVIAPVMPTLEPVDEAPQETIPLLAEHSLVDQQEQPEQQESPQPVHQVQPVAQLAEPDDTSYLPAPVANGTGAWNGRAERDDRSNSNGTTVAAAGSSVAPENGSWN